MSNKSKRSTGCLWGILGMFLCVACVMSSAYFFIQTGAFSKVAASLDTPNLWPIFAVALLFLTLALVIVIAFQVLFLFSVKSNTQQTEKSFISDPSRQYQILDNNAVKFADIAGLEEAKNECQRLIRFLENPDQYKRLGAKIPNGFIFEGPPGMGKTLLAKALANEAKVKFFYLSASELIELYIGVGAARVRSLFVTAKANRPCIIFIDELDAVGQKRASTASFTSGAEEREQTLNQFLSLLDGMDSAEGIIMIAATNRYDVIDPALTRPGRFDNVVHIALSSLDEYIGLLNLATRSKTLSSTVNTADLASRILGFSGADVVFMCNRAALLAGDENAHEISGRHFESAIDYMDKQRTSESSIDKIVETSTNSIVFAKEKLELQIERYPSMSSMRCKLIWMSPYALKVETKNSDGNNEVIIIPRGAISSIRCIS
jgi:cell division protease FtsH